MNSFLGILLLTILTVVIIGAILHAVARVIVWAIMNLPEWVTVAIILSPFIIGWTAAIYFVEYKR